MQNLKLNYQYEKLQNAESTRAESMLKRSAPSATNLAQFDFAQVGVVLATDITPCPRMIIVLLLCFKVGFFSALVSALIIAFEMRAVVFITAILAHKQKSVPPRKKSPTH